jgi:hypothetical protein
MPEWRAAVAGQKLEKETVISTGFRSMALLNIGNSVITVRPLTRLSVETLLAESGQEEAVLNLRTGRVRANIKPPAGGGRVNFQVRSPMATASVRGTVFDFDGARLKVEEGRVHLSGQGISGAYVGAGHNTAVNEAAGAVAAVIETLKGELSPSLPAGVDTAPAAPAAPASGAGLNLEFYWPTE